MTDERHSAPAHAPQEGPAQPDRLLTDTPADPPWWMVPHLLVPALLIPLLCATLLLPVQFHWELGRMAKFIDFPYFVLGIAGVACLAAGSLLGASFKPRAQAVHIGDVANSPSLRRLLKTASWVLFVIAVAAYIIWFLPVMRNPAILLEIFGGRWAELRIRETIGSIPGVTTLVQAQVPFVVLLALRWLYIPEIKPTLLEKLALVVIFFLAVMRNFVWSERIAVIEFLLPLAILFLRRPRYPTLTALAPLFAVVGLFVFFATFEYFRSWSAYYKYQYDSFFVFIIARLSGYYLTAMDNGIGLVRDWGGLMAPYNTAEWLWVFPLEVGQTWLKYAVGIAELNVNDWLHWNATPEFNNTSGIYLPFVDYGISGGLLFWFLFGMLSGLFYRLFASGVFAGMILFPTWFMGLLELPRVFYLGQARYFPILVIMLVLIFLASMIAAHGARAVVHRPLVGSAGP